MILIEHGLTEALSILGVLLSVVMTTFSQYEKYCYLLLSQYSRGKSVSLVGVKW
jgi:hypothetical protein